MNKRIKALMGQTLDEKFSGTWSTMDLQDLTKFTDRFAELIVRECIRAYNDDGYQTEYEQDLKVLKHFGVKE
jgi:hypothetical protein